MGLLHRLMFLITNVGELVCGPVVLP